MSLLEDAKAFKAKVKARGSKNGKDKKEPKKPRFKFQNRLKHSEGHWWAIENASKSLKPQIIYLKLIRWLHEQGFYKHKLNEFDAIIVFVQDNVVFERSVTQLWEYIFDYLENLPEGIECVANPDNEDARTVVELHRDKLIEMTYRTINRYLGKDAGWHYLPTLAANWVTDTRAYCYKFYQNCFVKVSKKGIYTKPYTELPGHIWDNQKLTRDFELLPNEEIEQLFGAYATDQYSKPINAKYNFSDYFKKIGSQDADFFEALQTIVGYLLHDFFESKPKAIMLTDRISIGGPSGRTGKGLLLTALSKMTNMTRINGKEFKESDNFKYQFADHNTKVIALDDISKKFNFEERFNDISEGIQVNQKGLKAYTIRAKMVITTNKTLEGESISHKDRRTDFALANYFSNPQNFPWLDGKTFGVGEYYNEWFFADWSNTQWQYFDNFMVCCIARYMEVGKPIQVEDPMLKYRQLVDATAEEFVDFMDLSFEEESYKIGEIEYDKKVMKNSFKEKYDDYNNEKMNQRKFNKWLNTYVKYKALKIRERKTNGKYYISFLE